MPKKLSLLFLLATINSCSTFNSIDTFYNAHKNDDQVTAMRVPRFMLTLVGNISPEMNSLIGDTKDLRYMQFPTATTQRAEYLNKQMESVTGNSFIEIYRKNDGLNRHVISIREKKNAVKEILIYNNNGQNGSFLYFKGNFDPTKVREMAGNEDFQKLGDGLNNQYKTESPKSIQEE